MSENAISVSSLSKWFNTSTRSEGLRETIASKLTPSRRHDTVTGFWALRDVSFEVPRGEVYGLIGHNGAGKSVLLKILAGITNPTEGTATIHGRIGALLELGTGFHPELSGRDNVFLNGSFLGLKQWEIEERYEEIIDFSGIRDSIHGPVKHYSSGMLMRLAFSIAATLAPEVIFLDEVWAVGDMDFQKKAFHKIKSLISDGRTVIIVSHSAETVASVSTACILMDHGRVVAIGKPDAIIRQYENAQT
jgi:lipopolysaccharide transport system ATP-binding protein